MEGSSAYFDGDLVIGFDSKNRVNFFGVGKSERFRLTLPGVQFLDTSIADCIKLFSDTESPENLDKDGDMFLFRKKNIAPVHNLKSDEDNEDSSRNSFNALKNAPLVQEY